MDYPISFAESLRKHLRALRKERGLTQAQLGEKLGVGQARIAEIESNPGAISVDQLLKILSVLGAALVLKDARTSVPGQNAKAAPEPSVTQKPSGPSVRSSNSERQTSQDKSHGSAVVPRRDKSPATGRGATPLGETNPVADVVPASLRNVVIPPKKGSW